MTDLQIARRTLFTRTASGLGAIFGTAFGAGFGPGLVPAEAKAGPGGDVWSQGYVANKGSVKLALYRKWPGNLGGHARQAASGAVPGAWLLAVGAVELRSQRAGKRIFDDERVRAFRFRRLDHGP